MNPAINLIGQRFGDWRVMRRAGSNKHGQAMFLCRCVCGRTAIVTGNHLRVGESRSCGCRRAQNRVFA